MLRMAIVVPMFLILSTTIAHCGELQNKNADDICRRTTASRGRLQGCNRGIRRRDPAHPNLADAYYNRGNAYCVRAIAARLLPT